MQKTFIPWPTGLGQGHSANLIKKVCPGRRAHGLLADDGVYGALLAGSLAQEAYGNLLSAKGKIKTRSKGRLEKLGLPVIPWASPNRRGL